MAEQTYMKIIDPVNYSKIMIKGRFSEGTFILFFHVALPDIVMKHEQLAATLLLYDREDVYLWLPRDCLKFLLATGAAFFNTKCRGKLQSVASWWTLCNGLGICSAILTADCRFYRMAPTDANYGIQKSLPSTPLG